MPRSSRRRHGAALRFLALLALVPIVAAACASDDDSGGGGATARGVTADTVKIGVAVPDLGNLAAISSQFDLGDPEQQIRAVVDGWREEGLLPVNGRDVELVLRGYKILSSDDQVGVCNSFVQDDEVFAVVGQRFFGAGAECVAGEFATPMITIDGALDAVYERAWPFYVSVRASNTATFRNWMHWADEEGLLEGKSIGIYFESEFESQVSQVIEPELERLGYEFTEKVDAGSGEGVGGGSRDQVAAQRFKSAGVDLLLPMTGSTQFTSFMHQAQSLDYRPEYVTTDFAGHTTDAGASIFPAEEFDGTKAMTNKRIGGIQAGFDQPDATRDCVENYERFAGEEVSLESPESAELDTILSGCDGMTILLRGLEHAGEDLTPDSFIAGIEQIEGQELAGHAPASYSSSRHDGTVEQRTIQWSVDCECWEALDPFEPLPLLGG